MDYDLITDCVVCVRCMNMAEEAGQLEKCAEYRVYDVHNCEQCGKPLSDDCTYLVTIRP